MTPPGDPATRSRPGPPAPGRRGDLAAGTAPVQRRQPPAPAPDSSSRHARRRGTLTHNPNGKAIRPVRGGGLHLGPAGLVPPGLSDVVRPSRGRSAPGGSCSPIFPVPSPDSPTPTCPPPTTE